MPVETLHFLIIAIENTGSVSHTCIHLLFVPLVASIMPINALMTFRKVHASTQ